MDTPRSIPVVSVRICSSILGRRSCPFFIRGFKSRDVGRRRPRNRITTDNGFSSRIETDRKQIPIADTTHWTPRSIPVVSVRICSSILGRCSCPFFIRGFKSRDVGRRRPRNRITTDNRVSSRIETADSTGFRSYRFVYPWKMQVSVLYPRFQIPQCLQQRRFAVSVTDVRQCAAHPIQ